MMSDRPPGRGAGGFPAVGDSTAKIRRAAALQGLVAEPTKLPILSKLGDLSPDAADLGPALGLERAVTSHQLALIRLGGLVESKRDGGGLRGLGPADRLLMAASVTLRDRTSSRQSRESTVRNRA